ncbi:MAG: hypothetical protein OXC60_02370 [Litoreibacter sp.]|nr:hypothetical protein [Litoreibacter sp.]
MSGRFLMIPMVLGIFIMGGALGLTVVKGEDTGELRATKTSLGDAQPLSAAPSPLTSAATAQGDLAPPTLETANSDESFVDTVIAMLRSSASSLKGPTEEPEKLYKTVCTKKNGFKSCKVIRDED